MARFLRIVGSLAIVMTAYWTYAVVAVPWIEPPAAPRAGRTPARSGDGASRTAERWRKELAGMFPPGAWELDNPKVLESDQVKLLLQDYEKQGDGKTVKIAPCTMIFSPVAPTAPLEQRQRRAVILEAPEGALLEFDEPFDLPRGKVGRLIGGRLSGRITIRSGGRSPGPEDDLLVVARDVDLNAQRIWTPHAVDFRLGPHHGRGSDLWIEFLPRDAEGAGEKQGPGIAGIAWFEVRRLERLHFHASAKGLVPDASAEAPSGPAPAVADLGSGLPVEVTCLGRFRFDPIQQRATFEKQVDVLRIHPDGPSDQLNCEELSIYFSRRRPAQPGEKDAERPSKERPDWDFEPRRIEARGSPVIVRAPGQEVRIEGERLEIDLYTREISLEGSSPVFLRQGGNEIHARSVHYTMAEGGRLGQVDAEGPGWLRGQMRDRLGQTLEARWKDRLQLRPHEGQQVLSVTGDVALGFAVLGRLSAAEIYCWLTETPSPDEAGSTRLRPDRMLARGKVQFYAPQLTGDVGQLEVWFEPVATAPGAASGDVPPDEDRDRGTDREGVYPVASGREADGAKRSRSSLFSNAVGVPKHHFAITGNLLQVRTLLAETDPELTELMIEGNVVLRETWSAQPTERPLEVRGEVIHVVDASRPDAALAITGSPARFEGRGLELAGPNINLNRGTNRLWIDGAGRMDLPDLPLSRDLEGHPLHDRAHLQVTWRERMTFDGKTIRFDDSVRADLRHAQTRTDLQTGVLEVILLDDVRFDDPQSRHASPQVERLLCRGRVSVESRSLDGQMPSSWESIEAFDFDANLISGESYARGPGRVTSIRRGSFDLLRRGGAAAPDGGAPAGRGEESEGLQYLNVAFQGSLSGNLHHRKLTFHDQVRTVYGPVDSWKSTIDPLRPGGLKPKDVLLECDELSVLQMPLPTGDGRTTEFAAEGNVLVESGQYTARAPRMTYAEAKDLLVLEGTGWTYAELYQEDRPGAEPKETAARKILFWPSTKELSVVGPRSLTMPQAPRK